MSDTMTEVETKAEGMWGDIKAWVRKEIALHAAGHNEDARDAMNPVPAVSPMMEHDEAPPVVAAAETHETEPVAMPAGEESAPGVATEPQPQ